MDGHSHPAAPTSTQARVAGPASTPQLPDGAGEDGSKHVALVLGRRFRSPGAWTEPDRLESLMHTI